MYPYESVFYYWAGDSVGSLLRREGVGEKLTPRDVQIVLDANPGSNDLDIGRYARKLEAGEFRPRRGRPPLPTWRYVYAHLLYEGYLKEEWARRADPNFTRTRADLEPCNIAIAKVARELRMGDGRSLHNRFYLKRKATTRSAERLRVFLMNEKLAKQ